jgi:hypothetical protein
MDDELTIRTRFRRFWLGSGKPDHPLSEQERESVPPDTAVDEVARVADDGLSGEGHARAG